MSKKLPKSLQNWLIPKLRRISLIWPGKQISRDNAKVYIDDGTYLNGNPKTKLKYKCAKCSKLVDKTGGAMDHISPVIDIKGFKDWDSFMNSLFCEPEGYQHLCHECHQKKSNLENKERRLHKRKKN